MAGRVTKTWVTLYAELSQAMRRWDVQVWDVACILPSTSTTKKLQTFEERAVHLTFEKWTAKAEFRSVRITMRARDRAIDNLAALVMAIDHLRLADVREITPLVLLMDQQLYPSERTAAPEPVSVPAAYRNLGVLPDAPMIVIEAAYRAQAKAHHPDTGGSTLRMQTLNSAMDTIRKARAVTR